MSSASEKFNKMTDEEIESWVSKNMLGQGANLALSILMRRSVNDTKELVNELKIATKEFSRSSEIYSEKIVRLTWILIVLTIFFAILTVVMAFK
jgi:ABC-type multidrug transport system permease subunit